MIGIDRKYRQPTIGRITGLMGTYCRRVMVLGVAFAVLASIGCKSKGGGSSPLAKSSDPLIGGPTARIPPQNLPVPGNGTAGNRGKDDPLLGSPTGRPGDRVGAGYSTDPDRFKGTYIPDATSTPASLASRIGMEDDGLRIEQAGGLEKRSPVSPPANSIGSNSATIPDATLRDLKTYGVTAGNYRLDPKQGGGFTFWADVPLNGDGAKRRYSAEAATAGQAARQVLDSVKSDRN